MHIIDLHASMGVGSEGPWPPWIFKHGTNNVNRALKVLFFQPFFAIFQSFFPLSPPSWKKQIVLFFANFRVFFSLPPWKNFCRRPCTQGEIIGSYRFYNGTREQRLLQYLLHLLENTFDRKCIVFPLTPSP